MGKRIKEIRGSLTQSEFGKILGVKSPAISKYESGRVPDAEILRKIAEYGGVSVDWLLKGERQETQTDVKTAEPVPEAYDARPRFLDKDALTHVILLARDWLRRKREKPSASVEAELISLLYEYWLTNLSYPDDQVISRCWILIKE